LNAPLFVLNWAIRKKKGVRKGEEGLQDIQTLHQLAINFYLEITAISEGEGRDKSKKKEEEGKHIAIARESYYFVSRLFRGGGER